MSATRAPIVRRLVPAVMLAFISLTLLVGCDPGFRYRPQGWRMVDESGAEWSTSIGDVILTHWGIAGTVGADGMHPEFEIHNRSARPLVLERIELVTPAGRYPGELPENGAIEARTVNAGATDRIGFLWTFSQPVTGALGATPQIVLEFRLEDQRERLVINYERVAG